MKTKLITIILVALTSLVICAATANAAEKKWEYPLGAQGAFWVTTDGTGGVAFVTGGDGAYSVVWLDSKGKELYKRNCATDIRIEIVSANANALILNIQNTSGSSSMFDIDRKGRETKTEEPGSAFVTIDTFPISYGRTPSDQSGFYIFRTDGNSFFLVRFSFE